MHYLCPAYVVSACFARQLTAAALCRACWYLDDVGGPSAFVMAGRIFHATTPPSLIHVGIQLKLAACASTSECAGLCP
jgi:hypothetical protein